MTTLTDLSRQFINEKITLTNILLIPPRVNSGGAVDKARYCTWNKKSSLKNAHICIFHFMRL